MFLHLGGDVIIPKEEIIAIIDLQASMKLENNRDYLSNAENEEHINKITDKAKAKSLIITTSRLYFSPISSVTLKKRSEEIVGMN